MKPNILFITTDQQHWRMMSNAGERFAHTPTFDRLAAEGTRFDRCYTTNPVCVPARYSLMTGHMPHVFNGMEDNFKGHPDGVPFIKDWINTPCMGHLMRSAGYHTAYGGKSHIEGPYGMTEEKATQFGFEFIDGDIFEKNAFSCAEFIQRDHQQPFFLWASFDQPHDICKFKGLRQAGKLPNSSITENVGLPDNHAPTLNETQWMQRFRNGSLGDEEVYELGLNRHYALEASDWDEETWIAYRNIYRHYMQETDRYIKHLIDALEASGQLDNTIIIITSDHGDHDGAHGLTMKRSFYEESAHVPLIVRLPQQQSAGCINTSHLISNGLDIIPTLCDFAGIETPIGLQGNSFKPLCEGKDQVGHDYIVCQTRGSRMLRSKQFKYCLYTLEDAEEEFYDLDNDPGEMQNLANDPLHREVVLNHRRYLQEWTAQHQDTRGQHYLAMLHN